MNPRRRSLAAWQSAAALIAGLVLGNLLARAEAPNQWVAIVSQVIAVVGWGCTAWAVALAYPIIFSSAILGTVGLEPMRAMGQILRRTFGWIAGTTVAAVVVAAVTARLIVNPVKLVLEPQSGSSSVWSNSYAWSGGLMAFVALALAFAFCRNQIEETYGRLFIKLAHGLENMLEPILQWTNRFVPVGIFLLTTSVVLSMAEGPRNVQVWPTASDARLLERGLVALGVACVLYVTLLVIAVRLIARIKLGKGLITFIPAMLFAGASDSVPAALPLTFEAMRRAAGVSNRVSSVVLPVCASLHRDGAVVCLLTTAMFLGIAPSHGVGLFAAGASAFFFGCAVSALASNGRIAILLLLGAAEPLADQGTGIVLLGVSLFAGNALSVFSHACATMVIARMEGEYWVPGPQPDPQELQGLKAELAAAEGDA